MKLTTAKARGSTSPLTSLKNQPVSCASASLRGDVTESQTVADNPTPIQARAKDNFVNSKKDFSAQVSAGMLEAAMLKNDQVTDIPDLQNSLITILKKNPKGMSLKVDNTCTFF